MPGVPSSRGCQNCRKQKKKCDLSKPSCSRCARLHIPCIGSGQLRYKFKNHTAVSSTTQLLAIQVLTQGAPLAPPSNDLTMLTSGFLSTLQVTDIRFDMSIYGDFLKHIPKRLGTNEALDASVCALTTAWPSVFSRQQSMEMVTRYTYALKALRVCLSDPEKAQSPDTLCAIYLIIICQGWIGKRDDHLPDHGTAMAHLLNVAASQNWQGDFETDMVNALCFLAMIESFLNPKIQLDPRLWATPELVGPWKLERPTIESLELGNLAKVSALLKDENLNLPELQSAYQLVRADCSKLKNALCEVLGEVSEGMPTTSQPLSIRRLHVRHQNVYGTLLMLVIILNAALLMCKPSDSSLMEDSVVFVDEVIALAQQASQYRPLGASATSVCLVATLAVSNDVSRQTEVEKLLAEYAADFESAPWLLLTSILRDKLRIIRLNFLRSQFIDTTHVSS